MQVVTQAHLSDDLPRFRKAIQDRQGNISRAAKDLGVSKVHAMNLVKRHGLNDWARALRVQNGCSPTGKPKAIRPVVPSRESPATERAPATAL